MSKMDARILAMNEYEEQTEEESSPVNSYERLFEKFEELRKESDLKTKELERRLEETENKLGISKITSWRNIDGTMSGNVKASVEQVMEKEN
jgi:hypothetical protein